MRRTQNFRLLLVIMLALLPTQSFAWGREGHKIVARIAAQELTPAAISQVHALLGGIDTESAMASIASWADEIRPTHPETAPWHYVDIEVDAFGYEAAKDCPSDNCVVGQIKKDERILADESLSDSARSEALKFLIHFVGDIHQPLHDIDNHDKGANSFLIYYHGHRFPMHSLWDQEMVEQFGPNDAEIAHTLDSALTQDQKKTVTKGTPEDWANEGFQIAKRDVYGKFGTSQTAVVQVSDDYLIAERPTIEFLLAKAGIRLAWLLNSAFSSRR